MLATESAPVADDDTTLTPDMVKGEHLDQREIICTVDSILLTVTALSRCADRADLRNHKVGLRHEVGF